MNGIQGLPRANRRSPTFSIYLLAVAGILLFAQSVFALPAGFTERTYASGLRTPTAMAFAPDGRLFVAEQAGKLRVIKNGKLLTQSFLIVTTDPSGERGLVGVAVHPRFSSNRYVYIYYTVPGSPPHNRVSRFTADSNNPDVARFGSEKVILELNNLTGATNHNGGAMQFGRDGKLYIGVGDNANGSNSQTLRNLLGKVLRLNDDGRIPRDNPFYRRTTGKNRAIYAFGLRNPFTLGIDPKTGKIYINDVGQNTWEEINRGRAGANYGWPRCEGRCAVSGYVNPIYQYATDDNGAITGGVFYRGRNFTGVYEGSYFFADYRQGFIRRLDRRGIARRFHSRAKSPVDLDVGPDGSLYYLSIGDGRVNRIRSAAR
ncbi:MAG: PQQ-dependent sugar dehydrogenase [Candidatus Kerfeldbacteria bacterium]|nr:PQQ-dependent sugar dehydrogenase [Candidatus Kerfeldbacteria bacterium]